MNKKEAHSHEQTSQTLHKHYKLQAFSKTKNILTNNSNANIYQIPIENKNISKKTGSILVNPRFKTFVMKEKVFYTLLASTDVGTKIQITLEFPILVIVYFSHLRLGLSLIH